MMMIRARRLIRQIDSAEFKRLNHARDAALRILGLTYCRALDFLDNRMDSLPLLDVV